MPDTPQQPPAATPSSNGIPDPGGAQPMSDKTNMFMPGGMPKLSMIETLKAPPAPTRNGMEGMQIQQIKYPGAPVRYEFGTPNQQDSLRDMILATTKYASSGQFTAPSRVAERYMGGWGSSGYIGEGSEQFNAEKQSTATKWINGIGKFAGTAASEIISGTAGLADGIFEVIGSMYTDNGIDIGKFRPSAFYDNLTNNAMEDFRGWLEGVMPHYYTQRELNVDWSNPSEWLTGMSTANFWTDKLIKNAGFAVGAIATGGIYGGAINALTRSALAGKVSVALSKIMRSERGVIVAMRLEKELPAAMHIDDIVRSRRTLAIIEEEAAKLTGEQRHITSIADVTAKGAESAPLMDKAGRIGNATSNALNSLLASVGEASIEAVGGYRKDTEEMTNEFIEKNHRYPTIEEKEHIKEAADKANLIRFGMNVALLTVSNSIQFPKFLKSYRDKRIAFTQGIDEIGVYKAETNELVKGKMFKGAGETYGPLAAAAKRGGFAGTMGTLGRFTWKYLKEGASEGFEEAAQYSAEVASDDYARDYFNGENANIVSSLTMKGIPAATSSQGVESFLLGLMTGGLMESIHGAFGGDKPGDAKKKVTEEAAKAWNENSAEKLLKEGHSDYMAEVAKSAVRDAKITSDLDKANSNGDVYRAMTEDAKGFFNFVMPRLLYGKGEIAKDEIEQYHSSKMAFADAKKVLQLHDSATSEELDTMIETRLKQLESVENIRLFVNARDEYLKRRGKGDEKEGYTETHKLNMMQRLFLASDMERRQTKMRTDLEAVGLDVSDLLDVAGKNKETLDETRNRKMKELKEIVAKDPTKELDKNNISVYDKLNDLEKVQNARELLVRKYQLDTRRTGKVSADPVPPHTGFTEIDLMDYEDSVQINNLFADLMNYSRARKASLKVAQALGSINVQSADIDTQLAELEKMTLDPASFIYEEDAHAYKETVPALIDDINDKYEEFMVREQAKLGETAGDISIIDVPRGGDTAGYDRENSEPDDIAKLEEYQGIMDRLDRIGIIVAKLDMNRPKTKLMSEQKRKIADDFMSPYGAISASFHADENYDNVAEIQNLLTRLRWMKRIYPKRKDLMETDAFKKPEPFETTLDKDIANALEWLKKAQDNQSKILKADKIFAMNKILQQWKDLGINLRGTGGETDAEKAEAIAIQTQIDALEQQLADAIAEAKKQAGVEPVVAGGETTNAFFGTDETQKAFVDGLSEKDLNDILKLLSDADVPLETNCV